VRHHQRLQLKIGNMNAVGPRLVLGPTASVGDISERLGIRQPQVSKHLRVLREAGVVDVEPVARRRIYHLREAPFDEIGDRVDSFEGLWEARSDSLETFLAR